MKLMSVDAFSSTRLCACATTGTATPTARTEHINARSHLMVLSFSACDARRKTLFMAPPGFCRLGSPCSRMMLRYVKTTRCAVRTTVCPFTIERDQPVRTHEKHKAFWNESTIQEFWSGKSWLRPDEANTLNYDMAKYFVVLAAQDFDAF